MKEFFKSEDFYFGAYPTAQIDAAKQANAKLNKLIESWPAIYLRKFSEGSFVEVKQSDASHKARLAFVEEIVKEPCKHVPQMISITRDTVFTSFGEPIPREFYEFNCKLCKIELNPTWNEKK